MENVFPYGARPHRFPLETKDEYDVLEGGLGEFLPNYTVYQCLTRLAAYRAAAKSRPSRIWSRRRRSCGRVGRFCSCFPPERDSTLTGGNKTLNLLKLRASPLTACN